MTVSPVFPDPDFYPQPAARITLGDLATVCRATLARGSESQYVDNIAPLETARSGQVSFFFRPKPSYIKAVEVTAADAVITSRVQGAKVPQNKALLIAENPHLSMTLATRYFYPQKNLDQYLGLDKRLTQSIDPSARIAESAIIDYGAIIAANVHIGEGTRIGPHAVIYPGVKIGKGVSIGANSCLSYCVVGDGTVIGRSVNIGSAGFGFAFDHTTNQYIDIPHLGVVRIGRQVVMKDNISIARGSHHDTVIGDGVQLDCMIHIAHNVEIGTASILAGQVGVAGSSKIGKGVQMGGQAGVSGHLTIGDRAIIGAQAGVVSDIPAAVTVMGTPAILQADYHRMIKNNRSVFRKNKSALKTS